MELFAPFWETWVQERFWRIPYSFRINLSRKKASQISVKPFLTWKRAYHRVGIPSCLNFTPGRYVLYFPFFSALK